MLLSLEHQGDLNRRGADMNQAVDVNLFSNRSAGLSGEVLDDSRSAYMVDNYAKADKLMFKVLCALAVISLFMSGLNSTWAEFFVIGLGSLLVPGFIIYKLPGTPLARHSVGVAMMFFAALQIHQSHGVIEAHFAVFALLALLLFYRDWRVIATATVVIATHHMLFNYLQAVGFGVYIFPETGFQRVLIHAAYVVFESSLLGWMAYQGELRDVRNAELHEIAGHLTIVDSKINISYRPENAQSEFAKDYSYFMDAIHSAVSEAKTGVDALNETVNKLTENSGTSLDDIQKQKNDIAKLLNTIESLSSRLQSVSETSSTAASGALDASQNADKSAKECAQVLNNSVDTINQLSNEVEETSQEINLLASESKKIGSVLDVIIGIAEQTNLLALNAAIEAARAGESGRGFAVVADEVRALATKTQQSTDQIRSMIDVLQTESKKAVTAMSRNQERAYQCVQQATSSKEALDKIIDAIDTITHMNSDIMGATEEQVTVSSQVSVELGAVNKLADNAVNYTEQTYYASKNISETAGKLETAVSQFVV